MIERGYLIFWEKDLTKYKISQISELTFLLASMIRSSVPPCQVRACQAEKKYLQMFWQKIHIEKYATLKT